MIYTHISTTETNTCIYIYILNRIYDKIHAIRYGIVCINIYIQYLYKFIFIISMTWYNKPVNTCIIQYEYMHKP